MRCARSIRGLVLAALLMAGIPAHADLLVGDYAGPGNPGAVFRYDDIADGAVLPLLSFGTDTGDGSGLHAADAITFEPIENVVYVADSDGQAVRVYAATAIGNSTPLRTLNPPSIGHPRQVAISRATGLQLVATDCCVAAYLLKDSGNAVPAQRFLPSGNTVEGSRTRLNHPAGIVLRASSNEIAIPDVASGTGVVLFFSSGCTGNCGPYRTIEGPTTQLGAAAKGIAFDVARDEIYVLSTDSAQAPYGFRISVFAGGAQGNVAPLRSVAGAATLLDDVHAIAFDPSTDTLYASVGGDGTPGLVLAFARDANGNTAPQRVIDAGQSGFAAPRGLAAVFDDIFLDDFE